MSSYLRLCHGNWEKMDGGVPNATLDMGLQISSSRNTNTRGSARWPIAGAAPDADFVYDPEGSRLAAANDLPALAPSVACGFNEGEFDGLGGGGGFAAEVEPVDCSTEGESAVLPELEGVPTGSLSPVHTLTLSLVETARRADSGGGSGFVSGVIARDLDLPSDI